MMNNSKRKERNVKKFSPKREKNREPALYLCNFLHVDKPLLPCVWCTMMTSVAIAYACVFCSAGKSQRGACELKPSSSTARGVKLVSEFMKYSQGRRANWTKLKFAALRAKCEEIRSNLFGRFVSERTV